MPPPAKPPQPLKLTFTTTSLRNVTVATDNDEYYYEIVSRFWESNTTKINRLDSESGKMIPKVELLKDEDSRDAPYTGLKFIDPEKPDTAPISPDSFLGLGDNASKNSLGKFTSQEGTRYRWQESNGTIELVLIDDPDKAPAVKYYRHHRHLGVLRMSARPYIEVNQELGPSMDQLIVSFLLAEGKRRR